jgi:hypothetical protein
MEVEVEAAVARTAEVVADIDKIERSTASGRPATGPPFFSVPCDRLMCDG